MKTFVVFSILGLNSKPQRERYLKELNCWISYGRWHVVKGGMGSLRKGKAGGCLCGGSLCDTPLTASALNGKGWGVALVTGVKVTLTAALGWLEVASGTAQKVLPKILEQMPSEAHVDPGVAAAVEAGQQHGDDEGHGCRRQEREESYCAAATKMNQHFVFSVHFWLK